MQKFVGVSIFLINTLQGLIGLEECVAGKYINGLRVVDLQLLFDDHDELENSEGLQDKDSK